jgi:release factor glutamine methyltransferase
VLLEDCLGLDRALLLAHLDRELTESQLETLQAQLARRYTHEPLAYIRGRTEFYGREFIVNQHVLEPRPETETMVTMLLGLPATPNRLIVDVGTGSGALAVTAACELPQNPVMAIDIDAECLEVARQNAERHGAKITFAEGNLLEPLLAGLALAAADTGDIHALLCNLPYVPQSFHINQAAAKEPPLAIFGGKDGLDLYRNLFEQVSQLARRPTYILTEALPEQHGSLAGIAAKNNYRLTRNDDFVQTYMHV